MTSALRSLLSGAILSGTPLLYATIAELIGERAGVVNLGLEGVMLMGAVVGFMTMVHTGSAAMAVAAAALAGAMFNMVFAFLVISRRANQLASGLALLFCGVGLSALVGGPYVGSQIVGLPELRIPWLADLPLVGGVIFAHDALVYAAAPLAVLAWWVLFSTRWGLALRAVGENPTAAFAAGKDPHALQYQALFIAGLLAGIAGAHLSLGLAKTWAEWMTAGRGFIAVALVIFSKWQPLRAIAGALLFGGAISLQLQLQALGVPVSPFLLDMLPYVLSLAVLAAWGGARRHAAPASLGRVFQRTG
ncbi:MAG TPA: ABC transporter permease [Methylomirabilota bacterium]|jgi:simple sugar transport system permease protein|nr:ABC transporter permease [Methylomirabilota bacterium]